MKIVFSELSPNYSAYTFPHAVYAIAESTQEISAIYNQGFLPYSGDLTISRPTFYLARSLRVDLSAFVDSSENRRVGRKMELENVTIELIPRGDFDIQDSGFLLFCRRYIKERFPAGAMEDDRLDYIINHDLTTHFLEFKDERGERLGIVIASVHDDMIHYWFAFFNNDYRENAPIGKWIMWQSIKWAKEAAMKQIYLGTCYGSKSLYKARDFKGIQFYDGYEWNNDLKELKRRVKEDDQNWEVDRWRRDNLLNK